MSSQVLYRKYRSRSFSEVIGQDDIIYILKETVKSGLPAHAYLFTGSRGTGKTSTARIFAQALNCTSPQGGDLCGKCKNCKLVQDSEYLDIIEIDAASNRGINEIRDLREKVAFAPIQGKYKVYIIDEVHMLTNEAFNALLKTLEEPPSQSIFILATTEVHKLPTTILSRVVRFDFRLASQEQIIEKLEKIMAAEKVDFEEQVLLTIATQARGSYRDAESLLEKVIRLSVPVANSENEKNGGSNSPLKSKSKLSASSVSKVLGKGSEEEIEGLLELILTGGTEDIPELLTKINDLFSGGINPIQLLLDISTNILHKLESGKKGLQIYRLIGEVQKLQTNYNYLADPYTSISLSLSALIFANNEGSQKVVKNIDEVLIANEKPEIEIAKSNAISKSNVSPKTTDDSSTVAKIIESKSATINNQAIQKIVKMDTNEETIKQTLIDNIRQVNPRISAFIVNIMVKQNDNNVTLLLPYKFHIQRLDNMKNRAMIIGILKELTGNEDVNLFFELIPSDQLPKGGAEGEIVASQNNSRAGSQADVVEDIFNDII